MLWQRLLFGSLMIVTLAAIVCLDAWVSGRGRGAGRLIREVEVSPELTPPGPPLVRGGELAPRLDDQLRKHEFGAAHPRTSQIKAAAAALPITLLVVLLAVFASFELGRLMAGGAENPITGGAENPGAQSYSPVTLWAVVISAGLAFLPWVELQSRIGTIAFGRLVELERLGLSPALLWLGCGFLGTALLVLSRKTTERALGNMAVTLFIIFYIGLLASFAVRVRTIWPGAAGAGLLVFWVMTVKCSDIGAFFTGRAIGKHKLCPWLSPGKTVEGAFGAVLGSILFGIAAMALWPKLAGWLGPRPLSLPQAVGFGAVMAIAGHLGDLVESAIKRDVGSKDSAQVVPAFGGLLDILDSPLFTAPIAWWLLTLWSGID